MAGQSFTPPTFRVGRTKKCNRAAERYSIWTSPSRFSGTIVERYPPMKKTGESNILLLLIKDETRRSVSLFDDYIRPLALFSVMLSCPLHPKHHQPRI